jgi:hypothetical protein
MFFDRLRAVSKIAPWKSFLIHVYVWLVLVVSWVLPYSIIPIVYDTNRPQFQKYFRIALGVYCWGVVIYNIYISLEVAFVLRSIRRRIVSTVPESDLSVQTMTSIAYRSLGHAATSSIGALGYLYMTFPFGSGVYGILVPLGMHFWFNVPWWTRSRRTIFLFKRDLRERIVMRGKMSTVIRRLRIRSVVDRLGAAVAPAGDVDVIHNNCRREYANHCTLTNLHPAVQRGGGGEREGVMVVSKIVLGGKGSEEDLLSVPETQRLGR